MHYFVLFLGMGFADLLANIDGLVLLNESKDISHTRECLLVSMRHAHPPTNCDVIPNEWMGEMEGEVGEIKKLEVEGGSCVGTYPTI